jgi:hypothetical protein
MLANEDRIFFFHLNLFELVYIPKNVGFLWVLWFPPPIKLPAMI